MLLSIASRCIATNMRSIDISRPLCLNVSFTIEIQYGEPHTRRRDAESSSKLRGIRFRPHVRHRRPRDRREPIGSTGKEHRLHAIATGHDGIVDYRQQLIHRPAIVVEFDWTAGKRWLDPDDIGRPKE